MIREVVLDQSQAPAARAALRKRLISGLGVGGFGLLIVSLGGWWFTAALGGLVHLGLLEFFRMAQFKGIRPATKTTLVAANCCCSPPSGRSRAGCRLMWPTLFCRSLEPPSAVGCCCNR